MFKSSFIKNYEKYVYDARREYYENITIYNRDGNFKNVIVFLPYIVAIIGVLLGLMYGFNTTGLIIALIAVILLNIGIKIAESVFKVSNLSNYENAIRRLGYFNIESYERKLKFYVTGKWGYYTKLLHDYMVKYDLNENSKKIMDINGVAYFIFTDNKMDKIMLLPANTNIKPKLIIIKHGTIRYYRVDDFKQMVVLKTNNDEYFFKMNALPVFRELFKDKEYKNLKSFNPEEYINDYKLFMHKYKRELNNKIYLNNSIAFTSFIMIVIFILCLVCTIIFKNYISGYDNIIVIARILLIFFTSLNINTFIHYFNGVSSNEDDFIKSMNKDPKVIERFNELKMALNIRNDYDTIYNMEGAPYLTWYCNGYFHLFLNMAYFDVVYMVINPKSIKYYKQEGNECIIKMDNNTLVFRRNAYKVFGKIIPNKDYNWLHKIEKNR